MNMKASVWFAVAISLAPLTARAQIPVCDSPSNFPNDRLVIENIEIKRPGEAEFTSGLPEGICLFRSSDLYRILPQGFSLDLSPLLPRGTKIRITARHTLGSSGDFGRIIMSGPSSVVHKHGTVGGDRARVTLLGETSRHYSAVSRPVGDSYESYCIRDSEDDSFFSANIAVNRTVGEWTEPGSGGLFTVDYGLPTFVEFPSSGERSNPDDAKWWAVVFGDSCPRPNEEYDARTEMYITLKEAKARLINPAVLAALDNDTWPLLLGVRVSENRAVEIIRSEFRLSYGEKESLDGLPTSATPTGFILTVYTRSLLPVETSPY